MELDEWTKLNRFAKKKYPDSSHYRRKELEERQAEVNHRISELEERILPFQEELSMLKDIQWLIRDRLPEIDPKNKDISADDIVSKEEEKESSETIQVERKEPSERKQPARKTQVGRTSILSRLDEKKGKLQMEDEGRQARRSRTEKKQKHDKGIY